MGVCLDACMRCSHPMTYMYHKHDYLYKQTDGVIEAIDCCFIRCFAQGSGSTRDRLSTHRSGPICIPEFVAIADLICDIIKIAV